MSFSELMKAQIGEELYKFCDSGSVEGARAYLSHKGSSRLYNSNPFSPMLEIAIVNNDVALAKYCLEEGAEVTKSVVQRIRSHRPYKVYEAILVSGICTGFFSTNSITANMATFAAVDDDIDFVKLCFAHGEAPTHEPFGLYLTALAAIAAHASVAMAELWLSQKSKVEILKSGALQAAAASGQRRMVDFLLEQGADIDEIDSDPLSVHYTPDDRLGGALHQAVHHGQSATLGFLLERGAKVNLKDQKGRTALTVAQAKGETAMAERLEKGCAMS